MTVDEIYYKGIKEGYSIDLWNQFLEAGPTAFNIYLVGQYWANFDFTKGFDELIKLDSNGNILAKTATVWKVFDFEKAADILIAKDIMWLQVIDTWNIPKNKKKKYWESDDGRVAYALVKKGKMPKDQALINVKNSKWKKMIEAWT